MEQAELDRLAWNGAELPDGLPYTDVLYYLMLRGLYDTSRIRKMNTEQGRREKARIADAVRAYRADQALAQHHGKVMQATESARTEYRKARAALDEMKATLYLPPAVVSVIAAGDRMAEALDNIKIGE